MIEITKMTDKGFETMYKARYGKDLSNTLKAYNVFIDSPENGCLLVYANTPGQAKHIGLCQHPGIGFEYIDFSCLCVPRLDNYARYKFPHYIGGNHELPENIYFYDDDIARVP